jgi:hypothetical protein
MLALVYLMYFPLYLGASVPVLCIAGSLSLRPFSLTGIPDSVAGYWSCCNQSLSDNFPLIGSGGLGGSESQLMFLGMPVCGSVFCTVVL